MSGAERTNDEIANDVFHALHPECPAFPGVPNACDPQVCDCFNCEQLPEKVAELVAALIPFAAMARPSDADDLQAAELVVQRGVASDMTVIKNRDWLRAHTALGRLNDVDILDIIGPGADVSGSDL